MTQNELGKRIKDARLAKGLSQEALANSSNISLRTIQRIEKGVIPRSSTLIILTEVLDIDYKEFANPNHTVEVEKEIRTLKRMNLSIILLILIPLANILAPLLIWKIRNNLSKHAGYAGKIISFQIIWTLATFFIFFIAVFSSNLITGTAGEGHYWAFIGLILCIFWNIFIVSKSTTTLGDEHPKFLNRTPNFF